MSTLSRWDLIYLPHLDYVLQQEGPNGKGVKREFRKLEGVLKNLIHYLEGKGVDVMLLSEYGISEVSKPIHLNRVFRDCKWVTIKEELGLEHLDLGASKAFAIADHQVAHVYVNDESVRPQLKRMLETMEGIERVYEGSEEFGTGIGGERAGDFIVEAKPEFWFTYYYWKDDEVAPDFARCIDIHRKCGYDPVELFIDPAIAFPKIKIAKFLAKKKLGYRTLLDVIPLDATLVKGSHGRRAVDKSEQPVFIGKTEIDSAEGVFQAILNYFQS